MKIVQADEVPMKERLEPVRDGKLYYQRLLGEPGHSPSNFSFDIYELCSDQYSPRHRHNFDQFRYTLEGELDYARDGKMGPGVLGYFPEGVHYGPQTIKAGCKIIILQFAGSSGCGYMGDEALEQGRVELKQFGAFKEGVFRRNEGVPGKKNMDAYQAIWEYMNKRPMVYPKGLYNRPFFLNAPIFQWSPIAGMPGVEEKATGVFSDSKTRAGCFRIQPKATLKATGRGIYFVLSGKGKLNDTPYRRHTTLLVEVGETADFTAEETTEILLMGLTDPALVKKDFVPSDVAEEVMEAAE